jgi:hypothetical protein
VKLRRSVNGIGEGLVWADNANITLRAESGPSLQRQLSPFFHEKRSFRPAGLALIRFRNEVRLRAVSIQIGDLRSQANF